MNESHISIRKSGVFGTQGSEHQRKEWITINGELYLAKINSIKREGTKEESAYKLAKILGIPCALYSEEKIELDGKVYSGCLSKSLLESGEQLVNIFEIVEFFGDWNWRSAKVPTKEKFNKLASIISEVTNIQAEDLKEYLMQIIILDYLICNKDRHYGNFAVIQKNDFSYRLCPIYDNGDSFLGSDGVWTKQKLEGKIAEYDKLKTKMFNVKGNKVFADNEYAKRIYLRLLKGRSMKDILEDLDIKEGHKQVIEARARQLEKALHI